MIVLVRMYLPVLLLLAWGLWKDRLPCMVVFVLMLPVLGLIALNMLEVALMRRRALVGMYLQEYSWLSRLLCRKGLLLLWQVAKATFFTFVLFVEAQDFPPWLWLLLILDVGLIYLANGWLGRLLHIQVKTGRQGIVGRRLLVTANTLLLAVLVAGGQLFESRADYGGLSWQQTISYAAQQPQLRCDVLAPLARLQAAQQVLAERFVRQGTDMLDSSWSKVLGWLIFFLWSALYLWAWSRLILGTLIRKADLDGLARPGCE